LNATAPCFNARKRPWHYSCGGQPRFLSSNCAKTLFMLACPAAKILDEAFNQPAP